jgi:chemotaxis protein histidine kinase CheA
VEPRARALHEGLIVVAEGNGRQVGLFVDELLGQQQVVIKSMETNCGPIDGVVGATILGDGAVALILDPRSSGIRGGDGDHRPVDTALHERGGAEAVPGFDSKR